MMLLSLLAALETGAGSSMRPLRVLVVEDSFMTARSIIRMLESFGAEVVGPAPSVQSAMVLLDSFECDFAILDINLGNETVEPVAQRLVAAGRPFIFVSGYAAPLSVLQDPALQNRKLLSKPVDAMLFERAIKESLSSPGAS